MTSALPPVPFEATDESGRHWLHHPRVVAVRGWSVAVLVYVLAVFHRSSLGVASLQAERRFSITPGALGTFVLLQLGVYAAMQVPTGILVDRFGPRRLLVAAASLMGLAQLAFAFAPGFGTALLARALLGCGDALTFISVLRFAAAHFSPRRYPIVVAVTATMGTVGNIAATIPLTLSLDRLGWAGSFATVGVLSLAAGALVWIVLPRHEAPERPGLTVREMPARAVRVFTRVAGAWGRPGTRLGFWLHFASMSPFTALAVLWGFPYLVDGLGFSRTTASATLLVGVLTAVLVNPGIGWWIGRHPAYRVGLAVCVCTTMVLTWLVVLSLRPGAVPHWAAVAAIAFTATGGPISSIAFTLARDYNRPQIVGTATGVVNVGGFSAAVIICLGIGWVLDLSGGHGGGDYRAAMLVMVLVQLLGVVQLLRWWRRARAEALAAQTRGEQVPVRVRRHRWDGSAVAASRPPDGGSRHVTGGR